MKKASFITLLGLAIFAFAPVSSISWKTTHLNLGKVKAGELVDLSFKFTNNSTEPVTILEAKGSCGCTSVKYPEKAIAPGSSDAVTAKFKSNKMGVFEKNIKVTSSASGDFTYLKFSGEVVAHN